MNTFITPQLCFPEMAYTVISGWLHRIIVGERTCTLGPGLCETEETKPYYHETGTPYKDLDSKDIKDVLDKVLKVYLGAYGGLCVFPEFEKSCDYKKWFLQKIYEALGLDLCLMAGLRFYPSLGNFLVHGDAQILLFYLRVSYRQNLYGEGLGTVTKWNTPGNTPASPFACACLAGSGPAPQIPRPVDKWWRGNVYDNGQDVNSTTNPLQCSDACKMVQNRIAGYFGFTAFFQLGPLYIDFPEIGIKLDSDTGQIAAYSWDIDEYDKGCFEPAPDRNCKL